MSIGKIEFDNEGKPVCEICKKSFHRLSTHVRQAHGMTARQYKMAFGLNISRGLCSSQSASATREKTLKNADRCIDQNLLKNGVGSRFKKGESLKKKYVSEETKSMLQKRIVEANKYNKNFINKLRELA